MAMDRLIHKLVEINILKGKITKEEADLYAYGYMLLVEKILIFMISILVAVLCDAFFEIILLCITFIPLRTYSGGYHAKSRWACMILSGIFLIVGIYSMRWLKHFIDMKLFVMGEILCGFVMMKFAPVDVEQRKITSSERKYFRKVLAVINGIEIILGIVSLTFGKTIYASSILVSIFLCACSLIGELIRRRLLNRL